MTTILLPCHREVELLQSDLNAELQGCELHFSYAGIHNSPISDRYALFRLLFDVESDAKVIGDGFQMLAQTAGQPHYPQDVGRCPDNSLSYRIYSPQDTKRYYNYLVVEESTGYQLFGFTSCHRFAGYFEMIEERGHSYLVAAIDGENTHPQDWAENQLESVVILRGESLSTLYHEYAQHIMVHHQPRSGVTQQAPIGWCSWYAYYADVTEQHVISNVACMQGELAELEWVLLDDGYQAFMGDWLTPSDKFTRGVKSVIEDIKQAGKKPAIWLAPFIAQAESQVFKEHPDWFVQGANRQPMKADEVTYGGWRCTPWYILDTSNPEVQEHLTYVVKTMREEWGVELFKLDANYWGTLKGRRYQTGVTGVEAYRLGMQAIAEGAGDAWLLGCNVPMWPSLGLVDAMRVSDDVERCAHRFEQIAKEAFYRSWQHRKLWQIDPDCATFTSLPNQSTERANYEFHRNVLLACGGLLLSGDPLPDLTSFAKQSLIKLMIRHKHNQESAKLTSLSLNHAFLKLTDRNDLHCLFNYGGKAQDYTLTANYAVDWYDYWSGEKLSVEPVQVLEVPLASGLTSRAVITSG
ncbi:glycosyl hydrolase [Vibrio aestuarianus subsp. cardii]|uniref:glycoside hydrolase family 36 protein n=1 Tax=Vibrio aestuarianus TaxID=28171 RepID=UPI001594C0EA|nr:alpha-galactosidase [Vibrio aestuarianus]MDE1311274.1 alpha-galactosidase [Vibrio aestuarianus]NGZ92491.1 glycosyl hydrolase [Vibrio aestuarianus subsp. cardii]